MHHIPGTGPGTCDAEKNKQRSPTLGCLQLIKKIEPYKHLHSRIIYRCVYVRNRRGRGRLKGRGEDSICVQGKVARKDFKGGALKSSCSEELCAQLDRVKQPAGSAQLTFKPFSKRREKRDGKVWIKPKAAK